MAKAKRTGNAHKGYYANYKAAKTWQTNRTKKLRRALKQNPGNEVEISKALSNLTYRRKTPTTSTWSSTKKRGAFLFKKFKGRVPKSFITGNTFKKGEEEAYWSDINKSAWALPKVKADSSMFSLGTRAKVVLDA